MCQGFFIFLGYASTVSFIILISVFSWLKYFKYDFKNNFILNIINENLNDKLINSISFRQLCKDNEEKLILGTWDGTIDGCDCEGIIFKDKCSKEKVENGCKHIFSIELINYTIFNSSSICVTRTKLNYREYLKSNLIISNDKECPVDYQYCGIIDTLGRKLCIQTGEICLINSNIIKNIFGKEDIPNNTDGIILTSIKLFQYLPCIFPSEKFWNYYYDLEPQDQRCTTKIKAKLYDERYEKLFNFTINKLQLYNENSITFKIKLDTEIINKLQMEEISLFGRNFLGFDAKVTKNYNFNKLISKQNLSNRSNFAQMIYNLVMVATGFLFFFLSCVEKLGPEWLGFKVPVLRQYLRCISASLFLLSNIFYLIINIIIFGCYKTIKSILNVKGDEIYNEMLKTLINDISINYRYSLAIIIITPFIIILLLVSIGLHGEKLDEEGIEGMLDKDI